MRCLEEVERKSRKQPGDIRIGYVERSAGQGTDIEAELGPRYIEVCALLCRKLWKILPLSSMTGERPSAAPFLSAALRGEAQTPQRVPSTL